MYFKKLELIGFKSFCNKTVLNFEPGVTAVVGPNGCGKSNIFDAIRWVLGEQSIKSLRGSDAQDVIFNGTDRKEPLSMAEVTLIFDNENRFFNLEHHEVAITRRIFRSGESEYLLNRNTVRLKDILDILLGTGIGAESYSLVAQGKIDLVLSSKPEERRMVFDEASGITKYKAQKREATRKLEETEQNLLRLNDIITEVKRQIGSLERQANKARRYKEVFEELKLKEINLSLVRKFAFEKEKEGVVSKLKELEEEESKLLKLILEQEAILNSHASELKLLQEKILSVNTELLSLGNLKTRSTERIGLNEERILELNKTLEYLNGQIEEAGGRLAIDEQKLNNFKDEYSTIQDNIAQKNDLLKDNEEKLNQINSSVRLSLNTISETKRKIIELVTKIASAKNDISESISKEQVFSARKKRLEIEKAKVSEEKSAIETQLSVITEELNRLENIFRSLEREILGKKNEREGESSALEKLKIEIENLERQVLTLESQKKFLDELKTKYDDIGESMNATIYLDKLPAEKVGGLVVKIKDYLNLDAEDRAYLDPASIKLSGEAKPIDLDTEKIEEKINQILHSISTFKDEVAHKANQIEEINNLITNMEDELRRQEIELSNRRTIHKTILEQFNKIKEEEEIINLELSDVASELSGIEMSLANLKNTLFELESAEKEAQDLIAKEQNSITLNNNLKEEALVVTTKTKTELEALGKILASGESELKMLEANCENDKIVIQGFELQIEEAKAKVVSLREEISLLNEKIIQAEQEIELQDIALKEAEAKYRQSSDGLSHIVKRIDLDKKQADSIKSKLYDLQMQAKDIDFKLLSIKERILQGYKIDLDTIHDLPQGIDENIISGEIEGLKQKLDSYGTVNLVAIEEYDELKKRYDFLTQQQNDLLTAKESLHEAILKINRTTKKMFVETFEKVREEFKNYFRLLFNGGDAQLFLIDENDPLESGIEIICRPPGKKLQNILLLSGGEKSLSAIALIFAIFKVKPAPFCVLDEIDAALDEANVDRFSRIFREFTKDSQFIVITHNKKTIANSDVMYGITMEESGISKVVSVKFGKKQDASQQEPTAVAS